MDNKFQALSKDIHQTERDKLQSVFPECFVEGKLDIDKLLNLCGEYIDESFEKYKFEWKGKADCFRVMGQRSTGTLRPATDESVDFDTTKNLYIEGDNLEVLKLLQTSYYRKVKMIYIDPPYNTGNDFVYNDDFKNPIAHYKEVTSQATKSNPETMGRFHTAWLNMMYPRLRLAANLLRDDGVIFISIDDNEVTNLRKLCDEVFGEENFIDNIIWKKRYGGGAKEKFLVSLHEYTLTYAKNLDSLDEMFIPLTEESIKRYYTKRDENFDIRGGYRTHPLEATKSMDTRENLIYPIPAPDGTMVMPKRQWLWSKERAYAALEKNELEIYKGNDGWQVHTKQYLRDEEGIERGGKMFSIIENIYTQHGTNEMLDIFGNAKIFPFPKPIDFLRQLLQVGTDKDSIILDFFSGSATTAHAVMQLNAEDGGNRRFIMVQLPEATDEKSEAYKAGYKNICEIGKERIRRAGEKVAVDYGKLQVNPNSGKLLMNPDSGQLIARKLDELDTSNLLAWDASPIPDHDLDVLWQRFDARDKTLKPDRSDMDIVFEVMLKMGLPLDSVVHEITVGSKKCYTIGEKLLVCLEFGITPEDITAMCDLAPEKIVCAEEAFADSNVMSNAHYILKDRGIEMKLL